MKKFSLVLAILMVVTMLPFASLAEDEPITLRFWQYPFESFDQEWLTAVVNDYNASQDKVFVELTFVPEDVWEQKLKAAQATASAPDIYGAPVSSAGQDAITNGTVLALDDYVDPAVWEDLEEIGSAFSYIEGKHWCFPRYVEPGCMLIWRKDMFEAAGLDPEKGPASYAELREYAAKLTTNDVFGIDLPTDEVALTWTTAGIQYGLTDGLRLLNEDWTAANDLDTDVMVEYVELIRDLIVSGSAPAQSLNGYASHHPIGQGMVAMAQVGSWTLASLKTDYPDVWEMLGVTNFPTADGSYEHATAAMGGHALHVDPLTEYPQECCDFLVWLFYENPEKLADLLIAGGLTKYSPWKGTNEVLNSSEEAKAVNPWIEIINNQIVAYSAPDTLAPWEVSCQFGRAIVRCVLEGVDARTSLQMAEDAINQYLSVNDISGLKRQ